MLNTAYLVCYLKTIQNVWRWTRKQQNERQFTLHPPSARQHPSYGDCLEVNIIRTALCWIVWHNVHSQQHTYMSSCYRSNRLGLSHWDPCAVHRGGCLELYYCNMVEWFWWDSSLISTTDWFNRPRSDLQCVEWTLSIQPTSEAIQIVWTPDNIIIIIKVHR